MARNILLTSPDILESDRPLRYYSVRNESGCSYCEALQSMEASTRYILSRFPVDEILIMDKKTSSDGTEDGEPFLLREAGAIYGADPKSLSALSLYRSRIAQYTDGLSLEQQDVDALLPEEARAKLIDFIQGFLEQHGT